MVSVLLAWDPRIDTGRLAARAGFSAERVIAALTYLAARGRVGYDLAELIQLLTQLMEDASDALAVQRAAAGG
jgi:NADH/NAD ratio-sensing transcriptional regulator Rex